MLEVKATKLFTGKKSQICKNKSHKIQKNLYILQVMGGCASLVRNSAAHIHFPFQLLETLHMQTISCVCRRRWTWPNVNIFDSRLRQNETLKEQQHHYQRVQQSLLVQIKFNTYQMRPARFLWSGWWNDFFKAFSLMDYIMIITDVSVDHEYTQILIVVLRAADTGGRIHSRCVSPH